MSSKDIHQEDDARLEAFLRKEDGLAKLLQEIGQPEPSAALDAAILAEAEAALQSSAASAAANDPAFPGAVQRGPLPFASRWKLPLSMAAAALLTLSVVWMQRGAGPMMEAPLQVAQAPAAPAAAPEETRRAEKTETADSTAIGKKESAAPKQMAARKAMQQEVPATEKPVQLAQESTVAAQAEMAQRKARDAAPDLLAKADMPEAAGTVWRGAPPAAVQTPAPPQAARAMNEAKMLGADSAPPPAKEWLKRIEGKIDGGQRQEALDEWTKFRKAYPDYEVPVRLREKMEELKK